MVRWRVIPTHDLRACCVPGRPEPVPGELGAASSRLLRRRLSSRGPAPSAPRCLERRNRLWHVGRYRRDGRGTTPNHTGRMIGAPRFSGAVIRHRHRRDRRPQPAQVPRSRGPRSTVSVRSSRYPALRQSGKHRRTASRSGPSAVPAQGTSTGAGRRQRQRPVGPLPRPYRVGRTVTVHVRLDSSRSIRSQIVHKTVHGRSDISINY